MINQVSQYALKDYISNCIEKDCASLSHINNHLLLLHKERVISDKFMYKWAVQLADEKLASVTSGHKEKKLSLFCENIVYHACLCSLAVNESSTAIFKDSSIRGHSLKEVSISCHSKEYLIATQTNSIYYFAFQGIKDVMEWSENYKSFNEGLHMFLLLRKYMTCG